jgi:hypothetical protein
LPPPDTQPGAILADSPEFVKFNRTRENGPFRRNVEGFCGNPRLSACEVFNLSNFAKRFLFFAIEEDYHRFNPSALHF